MASGSKSVDITGYDTSDYSYYSTNSIANCYAGSSSTSYGQINLTRGSGGITYIYFTFGSLSDIPANATINSVSCSAKCSCYYSSNSRVATREMQLYTGTTAKGTAYSFTSSASSASSAVTVAAGNSWTRAELQDVRLRLYAVRGTSSTNTSYYFRFYGATLSVTYTYQDVTYTVTATSNVSDVTITPATQTISSGGNATVTLSGLYKGLILTDNNTDVTSSISSGGTYTISNVTAAHSIDISLPATGRLLYKSSGNWVVVDRIFRKVNGSFVQESDASSTYDSSNIYMEGVDEVVSTAVTGSYNRIPTMSNFSDTGLSNQTYGDGSSTHIDVANLTCTLTTTKTYASGKQEITTETRNLSFSDGTLKLVCYDGGVTISTTDYGSIYWFNITVNDYSEGGENIQKTFYLMAFDDVITDYTYLINAYYVTIIAPPEDGE